MVLSLSRAFCSSLITANCYFTVAFISIYSVGVLVGSLYNNNLYHDNAFPLKSETINLQQYYASAPCQSNRQAWKYNSKENNQVVTSWGFPSKVSGAGTYGRTDWEVAIVMVSQNIDFSEHYQLNFLKPL